MMCSAGMWSHNAKVLRHQLQASDAFVLHSAFCQQAKEAHVSCSCTRGGGGGMTGLLGQGRAVQGKQLVAC